MDIPENYILLEKDDDIIKPTDYYTYPYQDKWISLESHREWWNKSLRDWRKIYTYPIITKIVKPRFTNCPPFPWGF